MDTKPEQDVPKTVGELRRRLAKLGNPWQVDPRLSDDDVLPDRPRGGQRDEEIPEEYRLKPQKPGTDLRGFIAAQPPANPFLRQRWVEEGLLDKDAREGLGPVARENRGAGA
jgi:hypothetical protein